jgi:hypothetical protein
MIDAADAIRPEGNLARLAFRQRDEFGDVPGRQRRTGFHDQRRFRQQHDWREIANRVVRQLGIDGGVRPLRTHGPDQQGVAVGRGLGDRGRAEHAAGSAAVLDDDRPTECLAEPGRDDARHHIDRAARGERHHDLDDLIWILFGVRRKRS